MTIGRRWSVAAAVLPLLVLGACSQDPEPNFSPPSQTPSATESTETSAAPSPEPWEEKSDEGAVAFAEHWLVVFNKAKFTGETARLAAMSTSGCESCTNFIKYLNELYGQGGRFVSKGWKVVEAVQTGKLADGEPRVALRIRQSPEKVHYRDPQRVERFPGGLVTYTAHLEWTQGGWRMSRLDLMS